MSRICFMGLFKIYTIIYSHIYLCVSTAVVAHIALNSCSFALNFLSVGRRPTSFVKLELSLITSFSYNKHGVCFRNELVLVCLIRKCQKWMLMWDFCVIYYTLLLDALLLMLLKFVPLARADELPIWLFTCH